MTERGPLSVVRGAVRASAVPKTTTQEQPIPLVVTISRESGIDGGAVARKLSEILEERSGDKESWPCYDRKLIEHVAEEFETSPEFVAAHDEHDESIIQFALHGLSGSQTGDAVAIQMARTIAHLGRQGRCIFVGRGGQSILAGRDRTVHVRLIGPEKWRAKQYAKHHEMDLNDALKTVRKKDQDRAHHVKSHFNRDLADVHLYNIVLNMSRVSVAMAAQAIACLLDEESTETG